MLWCLLVCVIFFGGGCREFVKSFLVWIGGPLVLVEGKRENPAPPPPNDQSKPPIRGKLRGPRLFGVKFFLVVRIGGLVLVEGSKPPIGGKLVFLPAGIWARYLRFLDVSIRDCRPLFDILTEGDGLITITEFCHPDFCFFKKHGPGFKPEGLRWPFQGFYAA